jgi:hypothetical protein
VTLQSDIIIHGLENNLEYLNESIVGGRNFLTKDSDNHPFEKLCWKLRVVNIYQALKNKIQFRITLKFFSVLLFRQRTMLRNCAFLINVYHQNVCG